MPLIVQPEAAALEQILQPAQQRAHVDLAVGQLLDVVAQLLQRILAAADGFVGQAGHLGVDVAQMIAALFIDAEAPCLHGLGQAGDHGPHFALAFGEAHHQLRFRAHLVAQPTQALNERVHLLVCLQPAVLAARDDALQIFQVVGGLFEQGLDIDGHGLFAIAHRAGAGQPGALGQPVLELVEEAVLRLACLQLEIAQQQRTREAEQRSAEGRAHAGKRFFQPGLELAEQGGDVAAGVSRQGANCLRHAADGAQQTPERAEQTQEHHQADEVARDIAAFIQARADAVEDGAQGRGGKAEPAGAFAHHGRHRCQQARCRIVRGAELVALQPLDPVDFGIEPQHLPEDVAHADQQHDEDAAVERGVVQERRINRPGQHPGKRNHGDQSDRHPQKIWMWLRHGVGSALAPVVSLIAPSR